MKGTHLHYPLLYEALHPKEIDFSVPYTELIPEYPIPLTIFSMGASVFLYLAFYASLLPKHKGPKLYSLHI